MARFLLTNDDGVHAPGLAALAGAVSALGEVVVLAPHEHVSGCSHQATTHRPLQLDTVAPGWHMLDGSPVDCTRVGLFHLAPDVDWVLAGINEGGNLGADVYLSGTVAAAREACLLGKPAIALSRYHRRRPIDWDVAARWAEHVIRRLMDRQPQPGRFWNVNLPDSTSGEEVPEVIFCQLDPNPLPVQYDMAEGKLVYRASYHERARHDGHDIEVCFNGRIAVTEIPLILEPPR